MSKVTAVKVNGTEISYKLNGEQRTAQFVNKFTHEGTSYECASDATKKAKLAHAKVYAQFILAMSNARKEAAAAETDAERAARIETARRNVRVLDGGDRVSYRIHGEERNVALPDKFTHNGVTYEKGAMAISKHAHAYVDYLYTLSEKNSKVAVPEDAKNTPTTDDDLPF